MPATKTISVNQVLTDISVEQYGSVEALFALALANGIGITDEPVVGAVIALPDYEVPQQVFPNTQLPPTQKTQGQASVMLLQTLLDITIQETGDLGRVFELALLNAIGITDDLQVGGKVVTPLPVINLQQLVRILQKKHPASGYTISQTPAGGIGYMQIQTSFIVS